MHVWDVVVCHMVLFRNTYKKGTRGRGAGKRFLLNLAPTNHILLSLIDAYCMYN